MGETRDPEHKAKDAPETPTTSSILGQAPFKLDLRIVPRPNSNAAGNGSADVIRLTPVDRGLLPEPEPQVMAPVVELAPADPGTAFAAHTALAGTALADPPAPQALVTPPPPPGSAPPAAPPPPPPTLTVAPAQTVAPGVKTTMPNLTAPFAARAVPSPGQLTLAPIAPRIAEPKPLDFNAILGVQSPPSRRRKQRHPFKFLVKLVVLAAVVGGGYLAVKKYVLTESWQDDVKVIADDVAERRGLTFDEAVRVEVLPYDDYALALASSVLGVAQADMPALGSEWRAMGLAEGEFDPAAIGRAALADQPAFYDPTDGTIYELENLSPELRGLALSQALTMALLDQHFDWSTAAASTDPSVRLGTRALFDGDAGSIRAETTTATLVDPAEEAAVSREIGMLRVAAMDDTASASPFGVVLVRSGAEASMHLFPEVVSDLDRNRTDEAVISSDAGVFDGARGLEEVPTSLATPGAKSVGMMYWYYALAGRIGSDAAWTAALNWTGDATVVEPTSLGQSCVTSTIAAIAPAGQLAMVTAFEQWIAAGPAESNASVVADGTNRLIVKSCDPGDEVSTIVFTDIFTFGHAPAEMAVVAAMVGAGLDDTPAARECVVQGLRGGQVVSVTEPQGLDRTLTTPDVDLDTPEARLLQQTCAAR